MAYVKKTWVDGETPILAADLNHIETGIYDVDTTKYAKPSGGIPKTDLASAVQTSLGKADTALQSYTETDPVFTASAAHGITSTNITNWNNKYAKPSGGIPKTDLASAVQTSLGKADTALQSYTETDPVFTASAAHGITSTNITNWNNKQNALVSGTNIKTINNTSLLGSGNLNTGVSPSINYLFMKQETSYTLQSSGWVSAKLTGFSQYKTSGGMTLSNNTITVTDTSASYLRIQIDIEWTPGNTTSNSNRTVQLFKNGTEVRRYYMATTSSSETYYDTYTWIIPIAQNDTIELHRILGGNGGTSTILSTYAFIELL